MYDYKILDFQFNHLKSSDRVFEDDLKITSKKFTLQKNILNFLILTIFSSINEERQDH